MKLVATADLHGRLPEIPECDVLVIAGDIAPEYGGEHRAFMQADWLLTKFTRWLEQVPAKHIIGIGGNHDTALFKNTDGVCEKLPWIFLMDEGIELCGVRFWGSPWIPHLDWSNYYLRDELFNAACDLVPADIDVIISHGPPLNLCDFTGPKYGNEHAGFKGWQRTIERVKPDMFICGHIHEGYGWANVRHSTGSDTRVCNVAQGYEGENPPVTFIFDEKHTRVEGAYEILEPDSLVELLIVHQHRIQPKPLDSDDED